MDQDDLQGIHRHAELPRELTEHTHPLLSGPSLPDQLPRAEASEEIPHEDADDLKVALERMAEIELDGAIPLDQFKKELGL